MGHFSQQMVIMGYGCGEVDLKACTAKTKQRRAFDGKSLFAGVYGQLRLDVVQWLHVNDEYIICATEERVGAKTSASLLNSV
jgi:hypothetical protein